MAEIIETELLVTNDVVVPIQTTLKEKNKNSLSINNIPILSIDNNDTTQTTSSKQLCLLKQYLFRVKVKTTAHKTATDWYLKASKILGYPPVLLSTISSILAGIEVSSFGDATASYNTAILCISSAIIVSTGLNSYLNYGERSAQHRDSSVKYSTLSNDIELFLSTNKSDIELEQFLYNQHEKIDIYEQLEPNLHSTFIKQAKLEIEV